MSGTFNVVRSPLIYFSFDLYKNIACDDAYALGIIFMNELRTFTINLLRFCATFPFFLDRLITLAVCLTRNLSYRSSALSKS